MKISAELKDEMLRNDCFLCRPNAALLMHVGQIGYSLAGLGPLADGYAVVTTHEHLKGLAVVDAAFRRRYADYTLEIAEKLVKGYGACFLIEHGNMAVCGISEEGREHCFHPHFLLIPDARCNADSFLEYFDQKHQEFATLAEALEYGAQQDGQYVLVGAAAGPFYVCQPVDELPRQFARGLAAEQLSVEALASWRGTPNLDWTLRNAEALRKLVDPS